MSEGQTQTKPKTTDNGSGPQNAIATLADLRDKDRFQFKESILEIPELGGAKIVLRSLSVREREMLPGLEDIKETDDKGKRTKAAIRAAAETYSVLVHEPKLSAEDWESFLGDWPTEGYDRVSRAYGEMIGESDEEAREARAAFPGEDS